MSIRTLNGKAARSVVDALQQKITHGIYRTGDFLGTEVELANAFRVSRTTVRNAMAHLEAQKMVRRGDDKGFILTGEAPLTGESAALRLPLLLIRAADIPLDNEIFEGVRTSPLADRFDITTVDGTGEHGNYADLLNRLPEQFRRVLLFPLDIPEVKGAIVAALARGVDIVQLDRYLDGVDAPALMPDHYAGACLATRHLLQEHRLPVHYFGNYAAPTSAAKRFAGWRDTMAEFGFDDYRQYLAAEFAAEASDFFDENHQAVIERFLALRRGEATSIFAVNDILAHMVFKACRKLGLQLGRQVFLVGFDDLELCTMLSPTLSSVAVDRRALGAEALKLVFEEHTDPCWRKLMPVRLQVRESSLKR